MRKSGFHHSEETKSKLSAINKGHARTEQQKKNLSIGWAPSEKTRAKISAALTGRKRKPFSVEARKHMGDARRGEKSCHWKGGKSFEPYCPKFNENIKESVRVKFFRRCAICGAVENGKKHHVHHIDYNKNAICNGVSWSLIPLCPSCHTKTNNSRHYYFNLLINYWALNENIVLDRTLIVVLVLCEYTQGQTACTRLCNQNKTTKPTSSRFKGVCRYKKTGMWQAKIQKNCVGIHLGYYKNEEDAAQAYDDAARKYFGEFARTNF